jgi:hypothetical protein
VGDVVEQVHLFVWNIKITEKDFKFYTAQLSENAVPCHLHQVLTLAPFDPKALAIYSRWQALQIENRHQS